MMSNPKKAADKAAEAMRRSAQRTQQARSTKSVSPLHGFSTFGIIGWSIAVPTVGGAFLGVWLDKIAPQSFSWPMALILGGIMIGGIIAWNWINKEDSKQHQKSPKDQP
ncbi:AtpZ/AtpI family protein [Oceanisphaera ostreae]|uniref:AtpZ/AtpI family protein n=1 Tax=Oceanisphaera ostreae TaxID=914151 RepID=A0ABW3KK32_9GAMM